MGTSLTGLTPATTYDALIKVGDNGPIDGTLKVLSDGLGTNLPMEASTTGINFTGSLLQGGVAVPTAAQVAAKQDTLVSGTNIKTINGTTILGSGNIVTPSTPPSGVSGAIQFSTGSAFNSDAANFFWDNTNKRLGVCTNTPVKTLNVVGGDVQIGSSLTSGNFNPTLYRTFTIGSDYGSGALQIGNGTTGLMWGGLYANVSNVAVYSNSRDITFETPVEAMRIDTSRNVNIGATSLGARVGIKGSGSTSATTSLLVQNSAGTELFKVRDDSTIIFGGNLINTQNIFASQVWGYSSDLKLGTNGFGNALTLNFSTGDATLTTSLTINSTTKGFLPPRMTTTQKNAIASPAAGLVLYDSTTNKLQCYNGSTWNDLF